ncbi:cytochrome c-type biogenesis protein [Sneathiella sp.]|uniref:cytochrome c-type biogenesis protein n=1 Tax=Sneathiella sp. TaxID=1964365 RepID=UPI003567B624
MRLTSIIFLLCSLFLAMSAQALVVDETLDDPVLEARAQEISASIRCLVCQNESILDSDADLAKDLRKIVREHIVAGESNDQVKAFLVARYGDWVLLNPPFKLKTVLLWLGPALIFLFGAIAAFFFVRGRSEGRTVLDIEHLTMEEQAALDQLLADDEDGSARAK